MGLRASLKLPTLAQFSLSLFIFNILFDPGNALFHTKILTFAFALFCNKKKMRFSYKAIFIFLCFYIAFFISTSLMLLRSIDYDSAFIKMYSTTFLTLILFSLNAAKINIWNAFFKTAVLISLISLILTFVLTQIPAAILFVTENEKLKTIFMTARHKKVLYWWLPSVFHRASPIVILAYAPTLYDFLRKKHREIKDFIFVNIFFWSLFFTGTRANIFSILLITVICYIDYIFYEKKKIVKTAFLIVIFCIFALFGTFLLLSVKNSSSDAKDGHLISYNEMFSENPSYILIGEGPGSYFFSKGFNKSVTNTEISYLELVRMFGIFFSVIILCCYCSPFLHIRNIEKGKNLVIVISYIAYLFIAGTNPLLIGPTGFMAWWITDVNLYKENRRILCLSKS